MNEPVIDDVLAANQAFYDAHEQRDIQAMRMVWEHSDRVICVHPGWPILRTWPMVEESWRRILAGPGRNQFILTNESVAIDGDLARGMAPRCAPRIVGDGRVAPLRKVNVRVRSGLGIIVGLG